MVTCSVWRRVGLEIWADGVHGSDDFLLATVHKTPWGRGSADDNADLIVQAPALCARIAELERELAETRALLAEDQNIASPVDVPRGNRGGE